MTTETLGQVPAPAHLVSRRTQRALLHQRKAPRNRRRWVRVAAGIVVLGFLVWQLGAGPFLDGLRATNVWAVLIALVVTAGTTWCVALRWSLLSARFATSGHSRVPVRTAYVAYYRSQLINATLPGGVVGDVHRGARHGWRSVVWDRVLGQGVQVALVGALLLPGAWRWGGLVAVALAVAAGGRLLVLSALSTAGHLVVFVVAAESVGVSSSLGTLLSIGALVLLGSAVPLNVAGWGPREGVAAWAFAAYGSTAATGLAVSVTFGVLATIATLPGLLTLGSRRG
jgi:glycosyltransferase 2 family protein